MEEKESIAKAEESISKVLAHINIALKQIKCERVIEEKDCLCKNWDTLTKADFQDLMSAGYTPENYQKLDFEQDSVFESLYFLNKKISVENMKKTAKVFTIRTVTMKPSQDQRDRQAWKKRVHIS